MPLTFVGRRSGFSSPTFSYAKSTPFLDDLLDIDLSVTQALIIILEAWGC